jgi:predicted outer membrane repeat protein
MRITTFVLTCLMLAIHSEARTITVDDDGPADFNNIFEAIYDACDGDTVIVADGTYTGPGNRDIGFLGKAITVRSESGPENCIIDCTGGGRGFYFQSGEDANSVLDGFTITNGYASIGGAIYCEGSSPTIKNCNLTENRGHGGGAVYCQDSRTTISNCSISDNTGGMEGGGGIYCELSSTSISECTITGNRPTGITCCGSSSVVMNCRIAENEESGILCEGRERPSKLTVADCIIANNMGSGVALFGGSHAVNRCIISANTSNWGHHGGGGIYCGNANLTVDESVITDNSAPSGGGIYLDSGKNKLVMRDCIISGNTAEGKYASGGAMYYGGPWRWDEYGVFTIRSCSFSDNKAKWGGAIYCRGAELIITDCNITGNWACEGGGGAIMCPGYTGCAGENEKITISNCRILDNKADTGAGMKFAYTRSVTVKNCVISGNSALGDFGHGGGTFCNYGTSFANCTITGNSAHYGGAIYYGWRGPTITNCILWANGATHGPQIYSEDAYDPCISYTDVEGGWPGLGSIDADPCFVEPGYWDVNGVWVDGDYRLWEDSPCIDTGDPNYMTEPNETDLDGNPRVLNSRVDMGAYEYWPPVQAEMKLTPQSLNCASRGKYIKAHITLPEGFLAEDVDVNEPALAEPVDVESEYIRILSDGGSPVKVEIGFDRQEFCARVAETGQMEVTVSGYLTTGQLFIATDTVKIGSRSGRR